MHAPLVHDNTAHAELAIVYLLWLAMGAYVA